MRNSKKGFIVPLIIVIVALLAIGGGAYVYTKNKQATEVSLNTQATPTNQVVNNATSTSNNSLNESINFYSLIVHYPKDWDHMTGDKDSGSSLIFNYNTNSEVTIGYSNYICSNASFSGCVIEFQADPNTTINNGKGDIKFFNTLEKYYQLSSYKLVEKGYTKINTPIKFYKDKNGNIVGIFNSKKDTFSFSFSNGNLAQAKEFIVGIDFK